MHTPASSSAHWWSRNLFRHQRGNAYLQSSRSTGRQCLEMPHLCFGSVIMIQRARPEVMLGPLELLSRAESCALPRNSL